MTHGMVSLEGFNVVGIGVKNTSGLHTLAEAIFADELDDLLAVLFLGVDPAGHHLVEALGIHGSTELVDLKHSPADGGASLLDFCDKLGVIENATGDLAVTTTETEHKVEG
jgi:hypothetical protein